MDLKKFSKKIMHADASEMFGRLRGGRPARNVLKAERPGGRPADHDGGKSFLLESRDVSQIYGRLSLIGVDPVLEIRGKGVEYALTHLNDRGADFAAEDSGIIEKGPVREERERTRRENIASVLRAFLRKNALLEKETIGLYGAFSYDFIRLFEDLPDELPAGEVDDFRLCLYDTFVFFDHLKESAEIIAYRPTTAQAEAACVMLEGRLNGVEGEQTTGRGQMRGARPDGMSANAPSASSTSANAPSATAVGEFAVRDCEFELGARDYEDLVEGAREMTRKGDLFEVVYSNELKGRFEGDSFGLYQAYRKANPSPYLFYFDFGDEQLVGASPEMMVRCEAGKVHMRPISGTAKRGSDPIEDHENMLALLSSEKERAELDMLIDLGRNDLARICKPGIRVSDYRFVEKYSQVMHTVAHLTGELKDGFDALDALIACMNAGTLTGAPKVAAMTAIEQNEKSRRGYYGGAVGYLTLSGEMDTGIIIRTAHIRGEELSFRVGATLLYDSQPEAEYQETLNKAKAFLNLI